MQWDFESSSHINDYLDAIKNRPEFVVSKKEYFDIINYTVVNPETFPDPNEFGIDLVERRNRILLRDCRGIKFYKDGKIAAKVFHKFFNVNERPETQSNFIDLNQPHNLMTKLDGSMIHPIKVKDHIRWCTKMGITDVAMQAEAHIAVESSYGAKYIEFAQYCIENNLTPIFEWCSRTQKIVLDYEHDELILLAVRNNHTGQYSSRQALIYIAHLYELEIINTNNSFCTINDLIAKTRLQTQTEGYVLQFDNGHMVKIKTDWYVALHKSKDRIRFEKDVISLILENQLDDLKPILDQNDLKRITDYENNFWESVKSYKHNNYWLAAEHVMNEQFSKKDFALSDLSKSLDPLTKALIFKGLDGGFFRSDGWDFEMTESYISKNLSSSSKLEHIRHIIGNHWNSVDN